VTTKTGKIRLTTVAMALALAACSPSPEELLSRAEQSLSKGDTRAAMLDLKSLLQRQPENAKARALLGEAYAASGDIGAAEIELAKAKELGAPAELVRLPACRVLLAQAEFDQVLQDCSPDAASSQKPQFQLLQGSALLGLERPADARVAFESALNAEPGSLDALLGVASAAQVEGGPTAALQVLDAASADFKKQAKYWLARGGLNVATGDLPAAEADYKLAVDNAKGPPDSMERLLAMGGLAESQIRQGHVADADETSAKLIKSAPNHPLVKQLRAQVAAAGGNTDEARALLEEVVAAQPQNYKARTMLALVTAQQGKLDQAQMHLEQVVANQPTNARAQRLLAEVRARLESPAESLADVKSALSETENSPELLAMAGRLSLASGDRQQAMTYLAAADKSATDTDVHTQIEIANGYLVAGELDRALEVLQKIPAEGLASRQRDALMLMTLLRKGDTAKLLQEANAVLQRAPKDATVRNLVGGVYAAAGRRDLARQQFAEAIKLAPNDVAALINLGRVDLAEGKPDAAEANFRKALEKDSRNLIATLGVAAAANARKDAQTAERFLLQAKDQHPDSPDARLALGQFYLQAGNAAKAKAVADAATRDNPKSGAMANVRGMILLGARDLPGAIASFEEAVKFEPKAPQFAANLARARLANRDASGALAAVDDALEADAKSAPLLALAATISLQSGKVEKSAGYVERLRQVSPDSPTTHSLEADLAMAQKRYKDALAHYRKASANGANTQLVLGEYHAARLAGETNPEAVLERWLLKNPGDVGVANVVGEQRRAKGDLDGAIAVYEAALAKGPDNMVVLNNLSILYDLKKDGARALDYAARAYKAAPKTPAIADTYGWMLFKQGKTAEALPLINEAAKGLPDNAEVQYHLAAVLAKNGDEAEATRLLKKAVAGSMPADQKAEAQKLLQQLSK
jgi:putative PEP-CTERM system TPR-repeat lipoprotein